MKRSQPIREILPVRPKQGVEVVYKRFSRLPLGGVVCTISYLESKKPAPKPEKKQTFLLKIAGILSRFRIVLGARLSRLRAKKALYRALGDGAAAKALPEMKRS
jgi:hypothetical protein